MRHADYLKEIKETKVISNELDAKLKEFMSAFSQQYINTIEKEG